MNLIDKMVEKKAYTKEYMVYKSILWRPTIDNNNMV